jgi:hypothetical protein
MTRLQLALAFLPLCILADAIAQIPSATNISPEYKAGQIWNYKTATGAEGSTILILDVQSQGKKGNLVHIRIDTIPILGCGSLHLTHSIAHLAVPEQALRKSTTEIVQDHTDLPEGYLEAYKAWQKNRHKEIIKRPLATIATPDSGCPVIVNFAQAL